MYVTVINSSITVQNLISVIVETYACCIHLNSRRSCANVVIQKVISHYSRLWGGEEKTSPCGYITPLLLALQTTVSTPCPAVTILSVLFSKHHNL